MEILTLNCGSSSAKYQLYNWANKEVLAVGAVERIGQSVSSLEHKAVNKDEYKAEVSSPTHKDAIELIINTLTDAKLGVIDKMDEIKAVGHRVVHGGEEFTKSVIVDDEVLKEFESLVPLAPLHMPANIMGIKAAKTVLPEVPHCAIMDTAWHQTMPEEAYMYAVPYEWYSQHNVRRYGFHGTSYIYTAKRAAALLGKKPKDTNLIIAHIGNGASICAVKNGVCVDTSMGLTPLEGLVMGTRSGDLDPAILPYMMNETGLSASEMDTVLNKKSGVFGINGKYSDRRDIRDAAAEGDKRCALAIKLEGYRLKKYIGSYIAALGHVDALILTAGVGEMAPHIREEALKGLQPLGIHIDLDKNTKAMCRNAELDISDDKSPVRIFVIPTDEELVMTEDTYALTQGTYDVHTNFSYSFESAAYVNKARAKGLEKDLKDKPYLKDLLVTPPKK
ncbi:MAG: acetate kinase [Spirochaetota bacterium]